MEFSEKQRREAIERIERLNEMYGLDSCILDMFKDGLICTIDFSEEDSSQETLDLCSRLMVEFRERSGAEVYYCLICDIEFVGARWKTFNIFYVGSNEEDWESERDLSHGEAFVYSYNLDVPDFSEYGFIGLANKDGYLARRY